MESPQMKSIHHLQSYPVVNDTYDYLSSYYLWAKEKSTLINYTCGLAETSVTKIALPVLERFHNQIEQLDSLTDEQLSRIDQQFPSIKKPTKEMISNSLSYCGTSVVQPKLQAVTRPIMRTYQGACDTVQNTKEYAENMRKQGYEYVEHAIQTADHYVDVYLPSDDEQQQEEENKEENEEEEGEEKSSELPTTKSVLQKTQRRILTKSRKNLVLIQGRAKELIENVLNSLGLLQILLTTGEQVNLLNKEFQLRLHNLESLAMTSATTMVATASDGAAQLHSSFINSSSTIMSSSSSLYQRLTNVTLYFISSSGQILHSLHSQLPSNAQTALADLYKSLPLTLPTMLSMNFLTEAKKVFQQIGEYIEEHLMNHLPLLNKPKMISCKESEKEEEKEKEDSSSDSSTVPQDYLNEEDIQ